MLIEDFAENVMDESLRVNSLLSPDVFSIIDLVLEVLSGCRDHNSVVELIRKRPVFVQAKLVRAMRRMDSDFSPRQRRHVAEMIATEAATMEDGHLLDLVVHTLEG